MPMKSVFGRCGFFCSPFLFVLGDYCLRVVFEGLFAAGTADVVFFSFEANADGA
jgi:hypothetical protein